MEVFILKLLPVDALTSSAILVGEVASLDHETFDDCKNNQTRIWRPKRSTSLTVRITQAALLKKKLSVIWKTTWFPSIPKREKGETGAEHREQRLPLWGSHLYLQHPLTHWSRCRVCTMLFCLQWNWQTICLLMRVEPASYDHGS